FGGALGGPLKKDKLFLFGNYEAFRQRLAVSSTSIVPGANTRRGLSPNGSPVPNLKPKMLEYAKAFWPAPDGPDLSDGPAYSYTNPPSSINEDFGLARFDYTISSKDSFSANYTNDKGDKSVPRPDPIFSQIDEIHSQTLGAQETHVFSSNLVN